MKLIGRPALVMVVLTILMSGCAFKREPIRYREDFFQPIKVIPQRNHSAFSSAEIDQLKRQLESATKAAIMVRDSLAALQKLTRSELTSKISSVDKVNQHESKEILVVTKVTDQEHNLAEHQSENNGVSQQVPELKARRNSSSMGKGISDVTPADASSSFMNEYVEGLSFFKKRKYSEALKSFKSFRDKGIGEDIVDNCEYWIGECHFARREYYDAIVHFQKVLSIESSNKKIDAYFMLGKTYERIGDGEKARIAYTELNVRYPNNGHAKIVKSRLNTLKNTLRTHTRQIKKNNPVTLRATDRPRAVL